MQLLLATAATRPQFGFAVTGAGVIMAFRESRPPEDAATLELGPDFDRKRVRCLWNSEVAIILNHHINQKREAADADDSAEISPMIQVRRAV